MAIEERLEAQAREVLGEELYTELKENLRQARAAFIEVAE
jgi:hypothetical protein